MKEKLIIKWVKKAGFYCVTTFSRDYQGKVKQKQDWLFGIKRMDVDRLQELHTKLENMDKDEYRKWADKIQARL